MWLFKFHTSPGGTHKRIFTSPAINFISPWESLCPVKEFTQIVPYFLASFYLTQTWTACRSAGFAFHQIHRKLRNSTSDGLFSFIIPPGFHIGDEKFYIQEYSLLLILLIFTVNLPAVTSTVWFNTQTETTMGNVHEMNNHKMSVSFFSTVMIILDHFLWKIWQ